jgi:uncharacterized sporulation protein YeaH/YhbH (DUF444 family)
MKTVQPWNILYPAAASDGDNVGDVAMQEIYRPTKNTLLFISTDD